MRNLILLGAALAFSATSAYADTIAYWDFNDQALPAGGFGWETTDLPQPADMGAGSLNVNLGDPSTTAGVYNWLQSFAGTTINDLSGSSGGSIAIQNATNGANNGSSILFDLDLSLYSDIQVSWAQQGTGTGFASRTFSYSLDGGLTFIPIGVDTNLGSFSFSLEQYDLSSITALNGASDVTFALTVAGGSTTSDSGNNRFDNFLFEGTQIPEPGTVAMALLGLASAGAVSMRSKLG